MITDPISDFLIQIKNGYMARKKNIVVSFSKLKENLAKLLVKEGYLGKVEVKNDGKVKKWLKLELVYEGKKPRLTEVVRVSKISRRIYAKKNSVPKVLRGKGIAIISNSSGLMTDRQARKKGLGGEVICKIY